MNGLFRKSALALMTAGTLLACSGSMTHALAGNDKHDDFSSLRFDPKGCEPKGGKPPAAPEVASWYIGAGVLGMLGIEALRRKAAAARQIGSN